MDNKTIAIKMVDYASTLLGLSDIEVFFKSGDFFPHKDVNSMFIDNYYAVVFNEEWLETANYAEIFVASLHETRHAYQKANIDFPEFFIGRESKETIEKWKANFENYIKPNGENDKHYLDQAIEKDAIEYSKKIMKQEFKLKV
ncbi:hypothetical protein [Liberiplasma polymorphum]|uniref:hypothetical protein n=1 Tax=Liberiplasma polymorphum TaxID=3374570 RepID=UPI003774F884